MTVSDTAMVLVGVDVGGTFTDLLILDTASGHCRVAKVPTTRPDQSIGIVRGIEQALGCASKATSIVHGTTVGTNTLLQRSGARVGVITTAGFRDVLEMRRRDRPRTWGLNSTFVPVVARDMRLEVNERVLADGTVLQQVDANEVREAARILIERGAQALCIFFINSYANPANERAARAALEGVWPNEHVSVACEVLPEIREFERASTASLNAYLQPIVGDYLARLDASLRQCGFGRRQHGNELLIVQSNGGVMSVDTARALPVRTALSGPAAGVIAATHIARSAGLRNVITCDMGGTSFDVAVIAQGEATLSAQTAVDFGMVIRTPMVEITTIGAGGGSIATVDRGGMLRIGPESAGSDPGPVCYGLGNDRPTVTDANLVLGRINATRPIGGQFSSLDTDAASAAVAEQVGGPLGLETVAAAEAIVRVANSRMAGAIRLVSIERGHDPRRFAAMAFGGGGALHVGALLDEVGLDSAIVPLYPGVTSALGCAVADLRHDCVRTLNIALAAFDGAKLCRAVREMEDDARAVVGRSPVALEDTATLIELDMLYAGQTHTVSVGLDASLFAAGGSATREQVHDAFEQAYRRAYGRVLEGVAVRVVNARVAVVGRRPALDLSLMAPESAGGEASADDAVTASRPVWVDGCWQEAIIYDRLSLPAGVRIEGPAVLEQPDATTFIEPHLAAAVDRLGNLIIERRISSIRE
ncbi:MAG: hydantoinase/oxoprolinase family protein [Gammaproteobacteria bacterium]